MLSSVIFCETNDYTRLRISRLKNSIITGFNKKMQKMAAKKVKKSGNLWGLVLLLTVFSTLQPAAIGAQDALFTQFNMSPLHYNPAFTGNTYAPLIHINSRVQWPAVSLPYNSAAVSYDQYFKKYRSGIGVYMFSDFEGQGIYSTFRLEALYSYNLPIRNDQFLKMGISLALVQNRLNWDELIFYDQIDPDYGYGNGNGTTVPGSETPPENLTVLYPDLSVGLLYYSPSFYAGVSVKHGNSPEQGILNTSNQFENGLALRYSLMAGGEFPLGNQTVGNTSILHPAVLYTRQANLEQLSVLGFYKLGTIYAGLGYRHAFDNPDAILVTAGIEVGMYTIAYSYDHTVSGLTANTGGSHELGVRINFDQSTWFDPPYRYSDCFEIFR